MEESPAVRVFASFALFIFSDPRSNLEYLYWLQLEREGKKSSILLCRSVRLELFRFYFKPSSGNSFTLQILQKI